jgi:tol-pal system protein YbgF
MTRLRRLSLILLPLVMIGCATSSDVEALQQQITDLQDQVRALTAQTSSKEEVQRLNVNVAEQTQTLLRSSADVTARVGEMEERLQNTQGMIEQTNYRLDRIAQQVSSTERGLAELRAAVRPGGSAGGEYIEDEVTVQAPITSSGDPLALYQDAYRDLQRGNFELARQGFEEYLQKSPGSDLADNAAYWIGETYFAEKKYRDAIAQFDRVINRYPRSDKVPAALLKKGYSYIEAGEKAQGIVQLQYVIHEHPRSSEASLARERLKGLGIETR